MPFHDNVYYPFEQDVAQVSTMLNAPWMSHPFLSPGRMPSSNHGTLFKFRPRHESVDWRRIGAIDVDRVANELDFLTLQDNIMGVTFCNVENEKCPHCHSSLDPVLIKLIRLTQFTIEYLLHSQEYLTSNLQTLEEKARAAKNECEQLQVKITKQSTEIKALKDECKLRKKMIAAQQMMISASTGPCHKCQHCEKSFVNYSYLEGHIKRRHAEDTSLVFSAEQSPQHYDNLHYEINCLKEELQFTKKQLETDKATHLEKLSQLQESEHRKTMELEVLKKFDKWKAEERENFEEEMRKVKEMFMKELKEVTDKNSSLENELIELNRQSQQRRSGLGSLEESPQIDPGQGKSNYHCDTENIKELLENQEEKWRNHIQELKQEYDREKNQTIQLLRQEHDREKNRVKQLLQQDFDREKNQIVQQLQQECEREKNEKNQIKELLTKPPPAVKKSSEPTTGQSSHNVERKHSATAFSTRDLEADGQGTIKYHVRHEVKNDHSLKKAIRKVIEQDLEEKLEVLGFKVGVRGIPSDKFQKLMDTRNSNRHMKEKTFPGLQKIYEKFSKHVTQKAEEQLSSSFKCASTSQPFTDAKSLTWGSTSSFSPLRQRKPKTSIVKSSQEELHAEPRYPVPIKSSTPKVKLVSSKEISVTKPSSITTPPFSSDDESESSDMPLPSYKRPDSLRTNSKYNVGFVDNESESDGSLLEEVRPQPAYRSNGLFQAPPKPARATQVKELVQQSSGSANLKPGAGDVPRTFVKKDPVMELKLTDIDDTELDSSYLEDEPYEVPRSVQKRQETAVNRKEVQTASVKHAGGVIKPYKADAREADTSSTLVSSLVTVSDFSDTSDI
ncbi:PREDICTED: zinc finger protein DZIP1 [Nanorana parkeri]|uniref:zinc finger protein DZIP1 n=1 Tax=Nanorana parkeri TaxID=125878 RepID=UPI0008545CAC|nr:PREDICTED: zinc finger protein DZIP1 [Nanorana parkeri]